MSLEMLGGDRIPPPLPPRSALAEQERERKRKQIAPWAVGKQKEDGEVLPGQGRALSTGKERAVGGTAPARVAGAGGSGTGESEGDPLLAPASGTKCALPGLEVF